MARRDKTVVELLLLFFLFMVLYIFSQEISSFFTGLENQFSPPPVKALFWFLSLLANMFGNLIFLIISYMVVGGIIYIAGGRK